MFWVGDTYRAPVIFLAASTRFCAVNKLRTMRVLYDGQIFNSQAAGGINRYFSNIISGLPTDIHPHLTTYAIPKVLWPQHPNLKIFQYRLFRPRRISYTLARPYFEAVTRFGHYNLAHPTYYHLLGRQQAAHYQCPLVITVYDMIYELFPEKMDLRTVQFVIEEKRKAILAAQAIICISEHTKQDLIALYPSVANKVCVTYLATDLDKEFSYGTEMVPNRPYFLFVGARAGYKNFDVLLSAFRHVVEFNRDVTLCVVGSPLTRLEQRAIAELQLTDHIEHFGYVDDNHLAKLYRCSLALVYPSLYEGFGIPPLEAMECGTIVIAADSSSIPEVVGNAGLLFDPECTSELTDMLCAVLGNSIKRDELIDRGYQRAKLFSWSKTVAETVRVYRSLVRQEL